ncbi:MAG: T9SS type A sorting domain-containing protein [Bacteroidetes bacterium]|nr:T9SS type A sorting domain-containing protein [Bacteroidota bacterium]
MIFRPKIIFLIFMIALSGKCLPQDNWVRQNSPVSSALFNCFFTDSLNGWAAGEEGVIIHTSDGGVNWVIQNNPVNYYINDIFFLNKNTGWCVSNEFLLDGTTILKTTNGGNVWNAEPFPDSTVFFRTIYFLDSLKGYLAGFFGAISKTTDGGNSWFSAFVDTSVYSDYPINRIKFLNAQTGFACGGIIDIAGVIWKSTDSGNNWTAADYAAEPFYDISLKNQNRLFIIGGDFEYGAQFVSSADQGSVWNYNQLGFFGQGQSLAYRTESEMWMALGFSGAWAFSSDSGNTWITIPVTDNAAVNSVKFTDSLHGWAVGNYGAILKYVPKLVGISQNTDHIPEKFSLSQNYPNPFNPKTQISFTIKDSGPAKLIVYDILGNEASSLVNEFLTAGSYTVSFDGNNFPSGVYFYKLTSGEFSETKRMVILK